MYKESTQPVSESRTALPSIIISVLLMLVPVGVAGQITGADGLFTAVAGALPSRSLPADAFPDSQNALQPSRITTIRSRLVRIVPEQLADARTRVAAAPDAGPSEPTTLILNLFDDVLLSAVVERTAPTASGTGYALSGRLVQSEELDDLGAMTLLVYGDAIAGTIHAPAGTFTIQPVGDGVHVVNHVDTSLLPPPGEPLPVLVSETPELRPSAAVTDPPTAAADSATDLATIDVAVFYTPAARRKAPRLTGITGITGVVDLMFENANAAFETSGAMQRLRLVRTGEAAYTTSGDSDTDLRRLEGTNDGFMDELHSIRDQYAADLVHLIYDPVDVCGIARLDSQSTTAFGLTGWYCETAIYAFAHEVGHNMGASHDRYTVRCTGESRRRLEVCNSTINNRPYAYSYGYVNQRAFEANAKPEQAWSTIMAYDWQCEDAGFPPLNPRRRHCRVLRRFSNPGMLEGGDPLALGIPGSDPSQEITGPSDAVRTFNQTRTRIAGFRGQTTSGRPDLAVYSLRASAPVLAVGRVFTLTATVRNEGGVAAPATTLTFDAKNELDFLGGWSEMATSTIGSLHPGEWITVEQDIPALGTGVGLYSYRACVLMEDGVSLNNCSQIFPPMRVDDGPDLVVRSATVSNDTVTAGQSFTFSVTVSNQGSSPSSATTLTYSQRRRRLPEWTAVGNDAIEALLTTGSSQATTKSIRVTAPARAGEYDYRACVSGVSGEINRQNDCSGLVRITVIASTNRPPAPAGTLPNRTLAPDSTLDVDLSRAFVDADGDALTYTASSSVPQVVAAHVTDARLRLTAVRAGSATIWVTATDPSGLSARQSFTATVSTTVSRPFTDDPIQPGVTRVRAVHFTELRARIDALRVGAGLGRFAWTEPVLRARVTPVRRVHLLELRAALAAAYVASGRAAPRWTDAAPTAGPTPIRAAHVTELRAAVLALE